MDRKRIIVGVAGGIAAYKACSLVRQLSEAGHDVRVVPTASALRFVGAATFEALSGHPVRTGVFEDVDEVPHVRLGQEADLVVVAPATADLLARAVAGRADDALLRPVDTAVLEEPVTKSLGRRTFLRVAARRDPVTGTPVRDPSGRVRVSLAGGQESHQLSALAAADAFAVVPESVAGLPAGAGVELWWLDRP